MDNPVVIAVSEALVHAGNAVLRFNFGGVGASEGTYDSGRAEQCDVGAAEAALAAAVPAGTPIVVGGYSFGAWVGARAAHTLPHVTRVVAIAPPLLFFDWGFVRDLGKPLAVVVGDRDSYCPLDALDRLGADGRAQLRTLAGADHFFSGFEAAVGRAVVDLLDQST